MTPRGGPLSENGKVLFLCILFPIFWPFLPAVLICMGVEKMQHAYWDWKWRRAEKREAEAQNIQE